MSILRPTCQPIRHDDDNYNGDNNANDDDGNKSTTKDDWPVNDISNQS